MISKKLYAFTLLFILTQFSFGQITVGTYTGITQLSNITSTCAPIVNTVMGDIDFATNSGVEIPMGTAFTGTWATGLGYTDQPGPEILCVSVHTEEWWDVELLLSDMSFTAPINAAMIPIEDYITLDFWDCSGTGYFNYFYDRRVYTLDFASYTIPVGLTVIGARFTLTGDNAANPDPIGMLLLQGFSGSAPPTASNNGPLCVGDTLMLTSSTVDSATYAWTGPSAFNSVLQNPIIVNPTLANAGTYTVIITDSLGVPDTAMTTVIINPLPTATFVLPNLCEQTPGLFSVTGANDTLVNYYWDFGTAASNDTSILANPSFSYNPGGMYDISLIIRSDEGCVDTIDTNIVVHLKPLATMPPAVICLNASQSFDPAVTADTSFSYNWTFPSGTPTSSTDSVPNINFPIAGPTNASLIIITDFGCMDTFSFPITVYNGFLPNFGVYPICISRFTFDPIAALGDSAWVIDWDMDDGTTFNDQDTTTFNYNFQSAGTYDVQMIVTDFYGCVDSATVPVTVVDTISIKMPNVLVHSSTVGNNKVDLETYKPGFNLCITYTYTIFDRWGVLVYQAENDPMNPDLFCNDCFQGNTENGAVLSPGVYFYVMEGNFNIVDKGFITIFD